MTERIVRGKFFIPSENKTKYLRLKIAKSTITQAGDGVYAVDKIPFGSEGIYRGRKVKSEHGNP